MEFTLNLYVWPWHIHVAEWCTVILLKCQIEGVCTILWITYYAGMYDSLSMSQCPVSEVGSPGSLIRGHPWSSSSMKSIHDTFLETKKKKANRTNTLAYALLIKIKDYIIISVCYSCTNYIFLIILCILCPAYICILIWHAIH